MSALQFYVTVTQLTFDSLLVTLTKSPCSILVTEASAIIQHVAGKAIMKEM